MNDWELMMAEHIELSLLPKVVDFDAMARQAEKNQQAFVASLKNEVGRVPSGVAAELKEKGFTDLAIYFGARIKYYTIKDGQPEAVYYKYTRTYCSGPKIEVKKSEILARVNRATGASMQEQIEAGAMALTAAVNEESFATWSNRYDGNIEKANSATRATEDYFNSLGLDCHFPPCREVSLVINGQTRRVDIVDRSARKAIEFKKYSEGKVYKSKDIENEVNLDKALMEQRIMTDIEWVFKGCEPSKPLRQLLEAGPFIIKIKVIP